MNRWTTIALSGLGAAAAGLAVVRLSMRGTGGEMVYPLDDTCIHLAMAKNLALHGVWGIEPGASAFCSSSPLWTLLLAVGVKIFGCRLALPLVASTVFVAGLAVVIERFFARAGIGAWWRLALVAAIGFATPFTALVGMGMEHALHALLVLGVVVAYCWRRDGVMCALAFLAAATRYESLFLLLPLAMALAVERKWRGALALLACSVVPALAYGAYAVAHGGHILPNSLLLKVGVHKAADLLEIARDALKPTDASKALMILGFVSMAALALRGWWTRDRTSAAAAALAVATAGHCVFVGRYQFYRYEAYLFCTVLTLAVCAVWSTPPSWQGRRLDSLFSYLRNLMVVSVVAALSCGAVRGISAVHDGIKAPRDIYLQQVQMARLFASLPEGERGPVAINDLGYMCLLCGAPVVDLWGLGTQAAAEMNIASGGLFTSVNVEKLIVDFGVKYAALFPDWFSPLLLPDDMRHVAILKNKGNTFCGQDEVWLYAKGDEAAKSLSRAAEAYKEHLPEGARLFVFERRTE